MVHFKLEHLFRKFISVLRFNIFEKYMNGMRLGKLFRRTQHMLRYGTETATLQKIYIIGYVLTVVKLRRSICICQQREGLHCKITNKMDRHLLRMPKLNCKFKGVFVPLSAVNTQSNMIL